MGPKVDEQKLSVEFERYLLRAAQKYFAAWREKKDGGGIADEVKFLRQVLLARARDYAEVAEREGLVIE